MLGITAAQVLHSLALVLSVVNRVPLLTTHAMKTAVRVMQPSLFIYNPFCDFVDRVEEGLGAECV